MLIMETMAAVLVAVLAVIGLYALLRWATTVWLTPCRVTSAVVLRRGDGDMDAATLDILLGEASRSPTRHRGESVLLLVSPALLDGTWGGLDEDGRVILATESDMIVRKYDAMVLVVPDL